MILSGKAGEQQLIKKEENVRNTRTNLSFTDFNLDTSNVLQLADEFRNVGSFFFNPLLHALPPDI